MAIPAHEEMPDFDDEFKVQAFDFIQELVSFEQAVKGMVSESSNRWTLGKSLEALRRLVGLQFVEGSTQRRIWEEWIGDADLLRRTRNLLAHDLPVMNAEFVPGGPDFKYVHADGDEEWEIGGVLSFMPFWRQVDRSTGEEVAIDGESLRTGATWARQLRCRLTEIGDLYPVNCPAD